MGLPPASFGREREDRSPYPMFQTTVDFPYDQYLGITGPSASTFYTVPFANGPEYIGVPQVVDLGLCADRLRPVVVSPSTRENKNHRMRKSRPSSSTDHVKHRRTRSGCLTCRKRRVKCDEARPQCERCRKGGRECVFPSDVAKKSSTSNSAKSDSQSPERGQSTLASLSDLDEGSEAGDSSTEPFEPTSDHYYNEDALARGRSRDSRNPLGRSESETPSCDSSRSSNASGTSTNETLEAQKVQRLFHMEPRADQKHYDDRLGFYLNYFSCHITYSDYGLVCDPDDFFDSALLPMAAIDGNEALLYGIAAFSAYQYALRHADGSLEEFLEFYNRSVTSVLHTLNGNEEPSVATLVTLLQLNAIEANFSDFPQLVSHHRAASEIATRVCKLDMLGDSSARAALLWYLHYDSLMSTLCDIEPQLPRSYVVSLAHICHEQRKLHSPHFAWSLAESYVQLCLIAYDTADYRAQRSQRHALTSRPFEDDAALRERLYSWRQSLDPEITNPEYIAVNQVCPSLSAVFTPFEVPYDMSDMFTEPLFGTTLLLAHWHFHVLLHEGMAYLSRGMRPPEELVDHAVRICQIWSFANARPGVGACTSLITPLRTAILFLPRDGQYSQWTRESLVRTETLGMMMAQPLRACVADMLHDQTCLHWWLPHNEKMITAVRNARVMADERWALSVASAPSSLSSSFYSTMAYPATTTTTTTTTTGFNNNNNNNTGRGNNVLLEIADAITRLRGPPESHYPETPLQ